MGITGLLPYLAPATRPCHISEFRGGTIAVDSYCLLHKGANACAEQLARGEDNRLYVNYCIKYVKMLLSYDIHPIMVFDGRNLPAKAGIEAKRREARKKARQRAAELLNLGKTDEAQSYLKQCVDITPKMAHNLIVECRKLDVDCIVAPYESDAQLAFFNVKGVAECVITEDSDLVLFGCKKVLYKLDLGGAGRLVEADKICSSMKMRPDQFTFDKFRFMCILSGCDYVNSLSGIGLKKAEKFMKLTAETNPEIFLDRIPRYLNMKQLEITDDYKKKVLIAHATFLHQVVFDPYKKKLVYLTDPDVTGTNPDYLVNAGEHFDNNKAFQVAIGNLNPYNFEQYDDWVPMDLQQYSIWSGIYKKRVSKKQEKENSKSRFQEFFIQDTIKLEEARLEQVIEEDQQIDNELSKYTTSSLVVTENIKVEEITQEAPKALLSPVVAKNPFLKNKRISKFPKTFVYGNSIVKSRFFTSETSVRTENGSNVALICETATSTDSEKIEILKSCENTQETSTNQKRMLNVASKVDSEEIISIQDYDDESNSVTTEVVQEEKEEPERKRIKLSTCRRVGLRKPAPPGQKTLHNFFAKLQNTD